MTKFTIDPIITDVTATPTHLVTVQYAEDPPTEILRSCDEIEADATHKRLMRWLQQGMLSSDVVGVTHETVNEGWCHE